MRWCQAIDTVADRSIGSLMIWSSAADAAIWRGVRPGTALRSTVDGQIKPAILLKTLLRLVPNNVRAAIAATAIKAAIKPYSIAVAPRSF